MAIFLNRSDFTVVARLFKLYFASRYLGLHVPLFDFLDPFPRVKRAAYMDNLVAFSEISLLVPILVNLSLRYTGWELLISCIIFLFLSELIHPSVPSIGVRLHLDHLAYF